MPGSKTATLSSLLVSKRRPEIARPEHPGLAEAQTSGEGKSGPKAGPGRRIEAAAGDAPYYKALTLKVDKARFTRLKALGVERDLPSQALLTEALDLLFAQHRV